MAGSLCSGRGCEQAARLAVDNGGSVLTPEQLKDNRNRGSETGGWIIFFLQENWRLEGG